MLNHPTMDKLQELKLFGMLTALREQMQVPDVAALGFDERFGLLVDREATERENRRLASRLKRAKLRQAATVEDIDYRHPRGLDKSVMLSLASCQWIRKRHNCIITGPTGAGKSYIACALAHKACREGLSVLYLRLPRMLNELAAARADGRYPRLLNSYARTNLLVLDDWGLSPLTDEQRKDLFEILEDRYDIHSTLVTSQLPISKWHQVIGDPSVADALLDRLVHNAHKLVLKGESMRKKHRHVED
jgi:DNA replication protein DnaC